MSKNNFIKNEERLIIPIGMDCRDPEHQIEFKEWYEDLLKEAILRGLKIDARVLDMHPMIVSKNESLHKALTDLEQS